MRALRAAAMIALLVAARERLGFPNEEIEIANGEVTAGGKRASFSEFAGLEVEGTFATTIRTVPAPLQNRQRSPSMSLPDPEHSRHLAIIWNSMLLLSGTLPRVSFTTSAW